MSIGLIAIFACAGVAGFFYRMEIAAAMGFVQAVPDAPPPPPKGPYGYDMEITSPEGGYAEGAYADGGDPAFA